ncbi:MAG: serine/threonine-protein kinase [Minicystis sp.]
MGTTASAEQHAPEGDEEIFARRIGTTLRGKWTLERLLGAGGMAAVYVGVHKIGRRDAIKILHPEVAENRQIAARFEQEAHAVNRFKHPGAVQILDIDTTEDGAPFLVMELLDGEPLSRRMTRGRVPLDEALHLLDGLLDVLAAAHQSGIIHRDIKPDNLFVLKDGRLKVLDFGIARMRAGAPRTMHTALGTIMGTLPYMPPEQAAGREIDARADLFSAGCTMFELVSGRLPHEDRSDMALMLKMATEAAPPLAKVAPGAPPDLCLVVDRALAFERDRRYPDAATMREDVRALREGRPPPYALARSAAGDLPNPPEPAAAVVTATEVGTERTLVGAPDPAEIASAARASSTAVITRPVARDGKLAVIAVAAVCATVLLAAGVWMVHAWSSDRAAQQEPAEIGTAEPGGEGPAAASDVDHGARPGKSPKRKHKKH